MAEGSRYDIAVIGGGPAGMMAAGRAAELGAKTILIEKNNAAGKKLLLTGKGRCNLTQNELNLRKLVDAYGINGDFLFSAFSFFGVKETIDF
ncbi:MAG: NAD(P)/FAD-dependent oxidoreductase, partial [bacterium]